MCIEVIQTACALKCLKNDTSWKLWFLFVCNYRVTIVKLLYLTQESTWLLYVVMRLKIISPGWSLNKHLKHLTSWILSWQVCIKILILTNEMFGSFCVFGHLLGMFWFALYCYGTYVCYQQIFFLLKNRSVEKIWGLCCCCCAAVYWKSRQDGSYSAGVCNLSPNENQMLMNQDIVAGWSRKAPALTSTTQIFTHTRYPRLPSNPLYSFFHRSVISSAALLLCSLRILILSPCQVPVQVSQFPKQTQRPFASGHLLARSACQDRCCLWKPSGGKNCLFRRYVLNTKKKKTEGDANLVIWKN